MGFVFEFVLNFIKGEIWGAVSELMVLGEASRIPFRNELRMSPLVGYNWLDLPLFLGPET